MKALKYIEDEINHTSNELINLATNNHNIDEFNILFFHIQKKKQFVDIIKDYNNG